jgi:hypothetical protein
VIQQIPLTVAGSWDVPSAVHRLITSDDSAEMEEKIVRNNVIIMIQYAKCDGENMGVILFVSREMTVMVLSVSSLSLV